MTSLVFRSLCTFGLLACGVLCLPFTPCIHATEQEPDLEKLFQTANERLDARDFAAAIDGYNRILEAMPDADNVWINRALAKWNLRDISGARADLAQALNVNPENPEAYRMRAAIRSEAREYAAADADMDKAISFAPEEPWFFGLRAEIRLALERLDEARADLDRAIELNDTFMEAYFLRATLLERQDAWQAAMADYSRVIELAPRHADAINNRGWLRFHRLDWAGAIEDGRQVLELAPKAAVAMRLVGYAEFAQGRFADAATVLAEVASLDPADVAGITYPLLVRHIALQRIGTPDTRLAEASAQWSSDPWAQAIAEFLLGRRTEEDLEALASEPEDTRQQSGRLCEAHFYIGMTRALAGDRSTARLRFKAAMATGMKTFVEHTLAEAELKRL